MAATNIGTGPTIPDARVLEILSEAIARGDHEAARNAQELLDLRTAHGCLAKHAEKLDETLDIANAVIVSLGGSRVAPDYSSPARSDAERDTFATGQRSVR